LNFPIVLQAAARSEFDEAFDYYEARRSGLGEEFAAAVQEVFDRLSVQLLVHQKVLADVRKRRVKRFPYSILYRAHTDRVEVIAVFHSSRDPVIWQARI